MDQFSKDPSSQKNVNLHIHNRALDLLQGVPTTKIDTGELIRRQFYVSVDGTITSVAAKTWYDDQYDLSPQEIQGMGTDIFVDTDASVEVHTFFGANSTEPDNAFILEEEGRHVTLEGSLLNTSTAIAGSGVCDILTMLSKDSLAPDQDTLNAKEYFAKKEQSQKEELDNRHSFREDIGFEERIQINMLRSAGQIALDTYYIEGPKLGHETVHAEFSVETGALTVTYKPNDLEDHKLVYVPASDVYNDPSDFAVMPTDLFEVAKTTHTRKDDDIYSEKSKLTIAPDGFSFIDQHSFVNGQQTNQTGQRATADDLKLFFTDLMVLVKAYQEA